jgi:hypothetical protein
MAAFGDALAVDHEIEFILSGFAATCRTGSMKALIGFSSFLILGFRLAIVVPPFS